MKILQNLENILTLSTNDIIIPSTRFEVGTTVVIAHYSNQLSYRGNVRSRITNEIHVDRN